MPDPAQTAAIFRNRQNPQAKSSLFIEYYVVYRVCKEVTSQLISEKYYKYLSSRIIGFGKVTCLQILTYLITKYAELKDNDIPEIYQRMKDPILGETIFE